MVTLLDLSNFTHIQGCDEHAETVAEGRPPVRYFELDSDIMLTYFRTTSIAITIRVVLGGPQLPYLRDSEGL